MQLQRPSLSGTPLSSRRAAIAAIVACLLPPAPRAFAQSPPRTATPPVIGFLATAIQASSRYDSMQDAFREGLKSEGYVEGLNVTFETIVEPDVAKLRDTLGRRPPDLLVAGGASAIVAKTVAPDIPLVFSVAFDPVESGLVTSLSRPGGNATGVTTLSAQVLDAKRLEYLRMLFPDTRLIGVLRNPRGPASTARLAAFLEVSQAMGQPLEVADASRVDELGAAIAGLAARGAAALLIMADPDLMAFHPELARLAAANRLPSISGWQSFATSGGLLAFNPDTLDSARETGAYAGRILKGARPADLPVIQPTRFNLTVNAKAARQLGISLPDRLLALANDVIE